MKNLSLLLNVVLVIAVAVLFYLHFSSPKGAAQTSEAVNGDEPGDTSAAARTTPKVKKESRTYFVNMDTLNEKYKLLQDVGRELRAKLNALESSYQSNVQKYQEDLMVYQQRVQENKITAEEAQRTEDNLRSLATKIQNAETSRDVLAEEMEKKNMEARKELDAFFEEYKKGKNIDFIFNSLTLAYGNDSLDITDEVLKGLNDRYEAKKSQPKK